ncbi:hypothetical protein ACWCRD_02875 [Streptomyces sp. NPDC002092]
MREHEWINTPEARQRRGERSLYAIDDAIHALENGKPIPENAERVLKEVSRETARASAWRMIQGMRLDEPTEPRQHDWDETPAEAARYDRAWDSNDQDIHRDEDE